MSIQEADLTRRHFSKCGYDSIQWAAVELNKNRIWNSERNVRYPLVSEDLWNKHLSSKRHSGMSMRCRSSDTTQITEDGEEFTVRLASMYATKLDEGDAVHKMTKAAESVLQSTGKAYIADVRFIMK